MSVSSFVPELFATNYEEEFRKSLVMGSFANRKYEGVIANAGDTVKVPFIGDVNIGNYTGADIDVQDLSGSTIDIVVDQQKYFAFNIGDIDKAQSVVNLEQAYGSRAGYQVANAIDAAIAALQSEAGSTTGSTQAPITVTAAVSSGQNTGIYEAIGNIARELDDRNVGCERFLALPAWAIQKLNLAGTQVLNTVDANAYTNGIVAKIDGFTVYASNNIVNGVSGTASKIMAGSMQSIAMVQQLTSIELVRRELKFGALLKGLTTFGLKVIQPDALHTATWSRANG